MKINSVHFAFIAVVMAVLSSCAFLQKGEFAQRKYYDFPRTKHTVNQITSVKPLRKAASQNIIIQKEPQAIEPVITASVKKKKNLLSDSFENNFNLHEHKTINTIVDNNPIETPVLFFKKSEIRKQALKNNYRFPFREDAGLMLFLAIIAAIFLPPLGIYIKENWRITSWFWATLILCILAGGFLGVGNAGFTTIFAVLWLAAVIIALMVVFDAL